MPDPWTPDPATRTRPLPDAGLPGPIDVGSRWGIDPRAGLALIGLLLAVGVGLALAVLNRSEVGTPVPPAPMISGLPAASDQAQPVTSSAPVTPLSATTSPAGRWRVHVAGQVRRPGVVSLPAGARVEDAVQAAGGPTVRADLAAVNLARPVVDGEQIYLARPGEAPRVATGAAPFGVDGAVPSTGSTAAAAGPVHLNTATLGQLDALPGVGPVLAQRIVQWRQEHGRFTSVDELAEVQGIGESTLEKLRPLVTV